MLREFLEMAAISRDLAARARRLAEETSDDLNRVRLRRYAEAMEEEAGKLEAAAARPH